MAAVLFCPAAYLEVVSRKPLPRGSSLGEYELLYYSGLLSVL